MWFEHDDDATQAKEGDSRAPPALADVAFYSQYINDLARSGSDTSPVIQRGLDSLPDWITPIGWASLYGRFRL